ncbi:hypothetical protein M231_03658 [Tremella mesenterica]|uniref:Uncharacterized protein n=1 Tax=Tremella mesenterica TaxID=5217 RepID=A0A4Q1BMJ4_TREME|nr:hypothetical protein M231_03658 [Tremella mesenterica]
MMTLKKKKKEKEKGEKEKKEEKMEKAEEKEEEEEKEKEKEKEKKKKKKKKKKMLIQIARKLIADGAVKRHEPRAARVELSSGWDPVILSCQGREDGGEVLVITPNSASLLEYPSQFHKLILDVVPHALIWFALNPADAMSRVQDRINSSYDKLVSTGEGHIDEEVDGADADNFDNAPPEEGEHPPWNADLVELAVPQTVLPTEGASVQPLNELEYEFPLPMIPATIGGLACSSPASGLWEQWESFVPSGTNICSLGFSNGLTERRSVDLTHKPSQLLIDVANATTDQYCGIIREDDTSSTSPGALTSSVVTAATKQGSKAIYRFTFSRMTRKGYLAKYHSDVIP